MQQESDKSLRPTVPSKDDITGDDFQTEISSHENIRKEEEAEETEPIPAYAHMRQESTPKLPTPTMDTSFSLDSILNAAATSAAEDVPQRTTSTVDKRASVVMRLAEENEKLDAELKALNERIAEAERRKADLQSSKT